MSQKFKTVALAGTFDHLHSGHQKLLMTACSFGEKVCCGLTTKEMNKDKVLKKTIQSYSKRENSLKNFFKWQNVDEKTNIFPIFDPFGPTTQKTEIEAIIATKETEKTVDKINQIRTDKGFSSLEKILVKLVPASDSQKLSSTRIRLGEINRKGQVFSQMFSNKELILPKNQRKHFKKPLGKLLKAKTENLSWLGLIAKKEIIKKPTPMVITVGDIVTQGFLQAGSPFSLAVIDYRSRRRPLYDNFHQKLLKTTPFTDRTINKPGTLSLEMINKIKQLMPKIVFRHEKWVLEIEGEEDLTVLPIVLLAPLESLIFYGQPDEGIVQIRVNEKIKNKAYKFIQKFSPL